mgnify:CR=1 FL=1
MQVIKARRSIRAFRDDGVPSCVLSELIEAGIWAPSGSNIQPWYFIIVQDKGVLEQVKAFSPGLLGNPPVVIIVCTDRQLAFEKGGELGRDELCLMDICMASQNIMLMATEKGLGTCAIRSFNKSAVARIIGLPTHVSPDLIISVGYPKGTAVAPKRKAVSKVAYFDRWRGHSETR